MRLNRYIALATGMSRRSADEIIAAGKVKVNNQLAQVGVEVASKDNVTLEGRLLILPSSATTIVLNKPVGYVCSRDGQGSKTIYDLLPTELHNLKPVGRLDKDSSGLLLLTNDGQLANELTHPKFTKQKVYKVELNRDIDDQDRQAIEEGIKLVDGISKLSLSGHTNKWTVTMSEGRNRQIRRTFEALNYTVTGLHRTQFGPYKLSDLSIGKFTVL